MTFFDTIRDALLAGFGVQEKVKEFIDDLVKKGELNESQGAKLIKEWTDSAKKTTTDFTQGFSDIVTKTLEKMNLPTRDDIEKINSKINSLSRRIKKLEGIKETDDDE